MVTSVQRMAMARGLRTEEAVVEKHCEESRLLAPGVSIRMLKLKEKIQAFLSDIVDLDSVAMKDMRVKLEIFFYCDLSQHRETVRSLCHSKHMLHVSP